MFPAGAANTTNTNDFAPGTLFRSITFNAPYTVSGNAITLGDGGLQYNSTLHSTVAVGLAITLSASETWSVANNYSLLTVTGSVHLNGHTLTVNGTGANPGDLGISGVIDGSGALVKNGAGDFNLGGANTYAGLTTINDGRLVITNNSALGVADGTAANGTVITTAGGGVAGILALAGVAVGNEALTIDGYGHSNNGAIQSLGPGPSSLAGPITIAANGTDISSFSAPVSLLGVVSGPGLLRFPNGNVTLASSNTYTGGTFFDNGSSGSTNATLTVAADQAIPGAPALHIPTTDTLVINATHVQTLNSITGSGTVSLPALTSTLALNGTGTGANSTDFSGKITGLGVIHHTSTGTQVFDGTSTFTGSLIVDHGTVEVATGTLPATVTVNNDGRLSLTGGATTGAIGVISGTLAISDTLTSPLLGKSGNVALTSTATFEIGATGPAAFGKLSVTGNVALGNAALSVLIAHAVPPVPVGSTLTIIDNDGTDAIGGTFAGLPEGATVTASNGATFRISYIGGTGNDVTLTSLSNPPRDYLLSEGATSTFFTTDLMLANPNSAAVAIHITFLKDDGTTVPMDDTLPAMSHKLIRVNTVPGMTSTAFSTIVRSLDGSPLVVERTMSWDATGYGAHTEHATDGANTTWYFAEGSQGFFHTYLLLMNPQSTANTATVQYLIEGGTPVTRSYPLAPTSRLTVDAGADAALVNQSFGMIVTFAQPGAAERAMYFGMTPLFNGGHESAGENAPSNTWFLAEGATGSFFETFLLLANPGDHDAYVTLTYLPTAGTTVVKDKVVAAHTRMTVNISSEDPSLADAAVSTEVDANQPILVERSQYWPNPAPNWYEAHNSFGVTALGTKWGLSEGRVGTVDGDTNAQTYILLANPGTSAANVTITFLRDDPATNVTHNFIVQPQTRFNVPVGPGTSVPELSNEHFGAVVTSISRSPSNARCTGTPTDSFGPPARTPPRRRCHSDSKKVARLFDGAHDDGGVVAAEGE